MKGDPLTPGMTWKDWRRFAWFSLTICVIGALIIELVPLAIGVTLGVILRESYVRARQGRLDDGRNDEDDHDEN